MDLREWLESRAGLSGKKLLDALQQCAEKSCESMEDLRFMHSKGKLENILSNGLLMMRVEEALDNEPDPDVQDTSALPSTKRTVTSQSIPTNATQPTSQFQQASTTELPPDFFHYFCSHKVCWNYYYLLWFTRDLRQKTHSVNGSSSEALARAAKDWLEIRNGFLGFFDVS